jgi:hypothetical protein
MTQKSLILAIGVLAAVSLALVAGSMLTTTSAQADSTSNATSVAPPFSHWGMRGPDMDGGAPFDNYTTGDSLNLTVTSAQATQAVTGALSSFTVGNVTDRGSVWMVGVTYQNETVANVLLGKVNTPTSAAAASAVQGSLSAGWTVGQPTQLRFGYIVPIIDQNGNIVMTVSVDGTTGSIVAGQPGMCR